MRQGELSAAEFLRQNKIGVGSVLKGSPIIIDGKAIELGREAKITAIGTDCVLAVTRSYPDGAWGGENLLGFSARDWSVTYWAGV